VPLIVPRRASSGLVVISDICRSPQSWTGDIGCALPRPTHRGPTPIEATAAVHRRRLPSPQPPRL